MRDRVFDRLVHFDERSKDFPVRSFLNWTDTLLSRTHQYIQLDQKSEGACVLFAQNMEAAARPKAYFGDPVYKRETFTPARIEQINRIASAQYPRAQEIDPFPPGTEGTSVLAGMQVCQQDGYWSEYRWALGPGAEAAAEDVMRTVSQKGPVIMGSNWYEGMYAPDYDTFLHVTGSVLGGHAYLLTRYSRKLDAVWTPNSWGGYGQGWISRRDLVRLLDEDGEACIPTIRLLPPRTRR